MTVASGRAALDLDWTRIAGDLDEQGYAVTPPLLDAAACSALRQRFDDDTGLFRSTVDMARHNYGRGRYRYFAYPLPAEVARLREQMYPGLARIANAWAQRLGSAADWPEHLSGLLERCHRSGQQRPTPLLLHYGENDYNCLHQDLYGEIHFPLQAALLLSRPGAEFDGGELVLVEQRPRMQSRPMVVRLEQGAAAIFPVRERPRRGTRGEHRVQMRHGVSRILRGERTTLGLIFHDAR